MSEQEQRQRQTQDYTEEVARLVPEYVKPIEGGNKPDALPGVIANLLALEKKTRLAADAKSTVVVCQALLQACWDCKDWAALNAHLSILTKRRAQLQKAMEAVIQMGAKFVKQLDVSTPEGETRQRELIETLRTVSAGKMFVELERAQLTAILAAQEEKAGRVREAADILQEIQVETIGSMDVQEKANYLLEQVRLVLAKRDYVRTEIIAKKLAVKQFNEPEAKTNPKWQEIKIKYYKLMIEYHQHFAHYYDIAKAYREIFNTASVQADPAQWKDALSKLVIYGILSPWDAELSDMLNRIKGEKKLDQLPAIKQVLTEFIGDEVMPWPLPTEAEWQKDSTFSTAAASSSTMSDTAAAPAQPLSNELDVSSTEAERKEGASSGAARWNDLHKRIVQHNIRVIAGYYSRITSTRLSELLRLPVASTEILLSEMVSTKQLYGKIDRPRGIIEFQRPQAAAEVLNTYAADLSQLLQLVERTTHQINKEIMTHARGSA